MGVAQVVERIPSRRGAQVSAVSPPGQPQVQLMLPAAKELAAQVPGRDSTGASGLSKKKSQLGSFFSVSWQGLRRGTERSAVHGQGLAEPCPASLRCQRNCACWMMTDMRRFNPLCPRMMARPMLVNLRVVSWPIFCVRQIFVLYILEAHAAIFPRHLPGDCGVARWHRSVPGRIGHHLGGQLEQAWGRKGQDR